MIKNVTRYQSTWDARYDEYVINYESGISKSYLGYYELPKTAIEFLKGAGHPEMKYDDNHPSTMTGWYFVSE